MDGARRFVVGLIGASVGASLSPPLHEREADELGLRYVYQLIDIESLGLRASDVGGLVAQAAQLGFAGLNITHPCKQAVVAHLDELSPDAAALGAVNTVVFTGGRTIGHNTDWSGFAAGFARDLPDVPLDEVVLLGAGGAGIAVAYALIGLGVQRLTVVDVDRSRADRLADLINNVPPNLRRIGHRGTVVAEEMANLADRVRASDGLVNASPVGMTPRLGMPLPLELLRPQLWVADIVYRPLETELLQHARQLGCRTLAGGGMTVYQAATAFELFTGHRPDADRMYRHFTELTAGGPVVPTARVAPVAPVA